MEQNITVNKKKGCDGVLVVICLFMIVIISLPLIPFETTVVPEWEITVVDANGKPLPKVFVCQYWQHYSLEEMEHKEDKWTDENGKVTFPRRSIKANLIQRIIGPIREFCTLLFKASYGPHSYVQAFHGGMQGSLSYSKWEQLEHTLVINEK